MGFPTLVPLGKMTITAAGTTVLLSVNCGPQAGSTTGTQISPPRPGTPFRQIQLTADSANTGRIILLPRGKTASANPEAIIDVLTPGQTKSFPYGVSTASGYLPENLCLDTDAVSGSQLAYGCGLRG